MNVEKSVLVIENSLCFIVYTILKNFNVIVCFIWYFPVVVETGQICGKCVTASEQGVYQSTCYEETCFAVFNLQPLPSYLDSLFFLAY